MTRFLRISSVVAALVLTIAFTITARSAPRAPTRTSGQDIFRFDTFGDEQLWTNVLRMHEVVATVNPRTALSVGLKVDADALPPALITALQAGQVDLSDPATTIALLRLNAVVGIVGQVNRQGAAHEPRGNLCALSLDR